MGANVFGLGSQLDVLYTTLCFVGLIMFTIAFEYLDRYLRKKLSGTVYHDMVSGTGRERKRCPPLPLGSSWFALSCLVSLVSSRLVSSLSRTSSCQGC